MTSNQIQSSTQITNQSVDVNNNIQIIQITPETLRALIEFGVSHQMAERISRDRFQECNEADAILARSSESGHEYGIYTIEYFPKDVDHDPEVVRRIFESLGFNVELKSPNVEGIPTNAVWFGHDVPISVVKLVALTLVRAGVALQTIKPFVHSDNESEWARLIQIGADGDFSESTILTASFINSQTGFKRDDEN